MHVDLLGVHIKHPRQCFLGHGPEGDGFYVGGDQGYVHP